MRYWRQIHPLHSYTVEWVGPTDQCYFDLLFFYYFRFYLFYSKSFIYFYLVLVRKKTNVAFKFWILVIFIFSWTNYFFSFSYLFSFSYTKVALILTCSDARCPEILSMNIDQRLKSCITSELLKMESLPSRFPFPSATVTHLSHYVKNWQSYAVSLVYYFLDIV